VVHLFNTDSIPIYVNVFNRILKALLYVQKHVLCKSYKAFSLNIWTVHIFLCYSEPALNWCQHKCYYASPFLKSFVLRKNKLRFGCGNPATILSLQQNETDTLCEFTHFMYIYINKNGNSRYAFKQNYFNYIWEFLIVTVCILL